MLVKAADQGKREFCIALRNRELHKNNCCPGNYSVDYDRGWFTVQYGNQDPIKEQRPELTAEADKIMRDGTHTVMYSAAFNTFLLGDPEE